MVKARASGHYAPLLATTICTASLSTSILMEASASLPLAGVKGWEVGLRPGACVDLTKGLCLCLRLGFIGYRDKFGAGEEAGLSTSGFGLRFAPEELQIGLELEL